MFEDYTAQKARAEMEYISALSEYGRCMRFRYLSVSRAGVHGAALAPELRIYETASNMCTWDKGTLPTYIVQQHVRYSLLVR
jgi:hypothetical protein